MTTIQSHRVSSTLQSIGRALIASASGFDEALQPRVTSGTTTISCPTGGGVVSPRPQAGCGGLPVSGIDDCASMNPRMPTEGTCATLGGPPNQEECATVPQMSLPIICEPAGGHVRAGPQIGVLKVEAFAIPMTVLSRLESNLAAYDLAGRLRGDD